MVPQVGNKIHWQTAASALHPGSGAGLVPLPMPFTPPLPLILVLGPTASGKSALAAALAAQLGGEVISADAMAVYRDMDVGTAKPDTVTLAQVPHHLISIIDPAERCDVQRWLTLAEQVLADIRARGRLPIVAGGSPLYTKALLEGLSAGAPRDEAVRGALDARYATDGGEAMLAELARVDPVYARDRHANDQRRIVRALEVWQLTGMAYSAHHTTDGVRRSDLRPLLLGLKWDKEALHRRINRRVKDMFANGLVEEVGRLAPRLSPEAAQAVGYKEILALLSGTPFDLETAIYHVSRNTRNLAKHQLTWYRRFTDIRWLAGDDPELGTVALTACRDWLAAAS